MEGGTENSELAEIGEWRKIMDEADDNGDGEIDADEFKNLMYELVPLNAS
jgi:Ca2+-binding EF-hand superfamily protein